MIGYLYLTLALIGGLTKGFAGKKISNDVDNLKDCVFINLLRMFFCACLGFFFFAIGGDFELLKITVQNLPVYLFSAVSMISFCITYMFAYKFSAYMYLSIFGMLGSVLTCFLGNIIYDEKIGINKWIGMAIILAAVIIMSKYNRAIKSKMSKKGFLILILSLISSSLADFSQKIYVNQIGEDAKVFNLYTYLFASVLLLIILPFAKGGFKKKSGTTLYDFKHIFICFIIAVGLYLNSYSKTFAAGYLSSAEIYPVLQGANLISSAVLAHILLKERINKKSILGMTCAFVGLLVMHLF